MARVWTGSGYQDIPTFDAADFGTFQEAQFGSTGDNPLFAERWGFGNRNDSMAKYGPGWGRLAQYGDPNYQILSNDANGFRARIKSGDKEGTEINWKLVDGKYVPQSIGEKSYWDTNNASSNLGIASVLGAGLLGAGAAAYGVGGSSLAGSGSFVGGPGMTGAGLVSEGAVAGGLGGASGISGASVESLWPGAQSSLGTAGTGIEGGYLGALEGGAAGGVSGGGSFVDQLKEYYDYYKRAQQVNNLVGGGQQQGGQRAGGGSNMSWLDSLFNMGGSVYSANKNDNYADELRQMAAQRQAERQPFLDRLSRSYENPNEFLQGDYKAVGDIEANRLARLGARGGTNANDIDRTRLLEAHGMKALGDYRQGLQQSIDRTPNPQDLYLKAMEADRMKNSPLFAGGAYSGLGGSGGGGLPAGMIGGAAGQIGNWWDDLQNWWGGGVTGDAIESWDISDWLDSGISGL